MRKNKYGMKIPLLFTAFLALSAILFGCAKIDPKTRPTNEQVMYGNLHSKEPTNNSERKLLEKAKAADERFVKAITSEDLTKATASKLAAKRGWEYLNKKKDYATSMKRFNQAWLLDKENSEAYHGFAVITFMRDGLNEEAERLFKIAISKPGVSTTTHVNYARFLMMDSRLDESIERIKTVLEIDPKTRGARAQAFYSYYLKEDYSEACRWGNLAKTNGDKLKDRDLKRACKNAEK